MLFLKSNKSWIWKSEEDMRRYPDGEGQSTDIENESIGRVSLSVGPKEITRASKATVKFPQLNQTKVQDVKTKVSETEIVAGREGSRTVADPLASVRMASTAQFHPIGRAARS